MAVKLVLKEGAPPVEELLIRVGVFRVYKPNLESYDPIPEINVERPTGTVEALLYDKRFVDEGEYSIQEMVDDDDCTSTWDLVDAEGNIWSKWVDDASDV